MRERFIDCCALSFYLFSLSQQKSSAFNSKKIDLAKPCRFLSRTFNSKQLSIKLKFR
jgi:hypothetical protein